ncbi:MAG TPA: hypothetical protein PKW63_06635 [Vicinamibacterales bacterium]|jgi:hypothetical protein|nr:hypothetical protein [Vicinamibacterales bacterium]
MKQQLTAGILVFAMAGAACGKSAEQEQAEKTAQAIADATKAGADQMAAGAAAMTKGLEQMAQGASGAGGKVEVLPFEKLGEAFPEVSGWTRGEITGSTSTFPMSISQSEASYRKDDARIKVEVVDAALAQMLFVPFSMFLSSNFSERSSDGYKKGTSVKGEPAFEDVNTKNQSAELTVVVGKRFIVTGRGSQGAGIEPVRAVLEQMDFTKLTAAK